MKPKKRSVRKPAKPSARSGKHKTLRASLDLHQPTPIWNVSGLAMYGVTVYGLLRALCDFGSGANLDRLVEKLEGCDLDLELVSLNPSLLKRLAMPSGAVRPVILHNAIQLTVLTHHPRQPLLSIVFAPPDPTAHL